jgi:large subunit ribosomal protein L43
MSVRGVWQMSNLTLYFCKQGGSSRGVREFLNTEEIVRFARENPSIQISVKEKRNRHPHAVAQYANNIIQRNDLRNVESMGVLPVMYRLRNRLPRRQTEFKFWNRARTHTRSVQGQWDYSQYLMMGATLPEPTARDPHAQDRGPIFKPHKLTQGSFLVDPPPPSKEKKFNIVVPKN